VCELCGNAYARSAGLKQHIISQHSEQVNPWEQVYTYIETGQSIAKG
jgi:hypothetical protein